LTSVRWSQTDRFAKADVNQIGEQEPFWAKIAQNAFFILHRSVVTVFASRWLATSGRWSIVRHKRTLAPVTGQSLVFCPSLQGEAVAICRR
jgi:hypothetical protein